MNNIMELKIKAGWRTMEGCEWLVKRFTFNEHSDIYEEIEDHRDARQSEADELVRRWQIGGEKVGLYFFSEILLYNERDVS